MLNEFKARTQFIIITHNPRTTTEAADAVYGVTSLVLGAGMLALAINVYRRREGSQALRATRKLFAFSILYLFALFATLLVEVVARAVAPLIW